MGWNQPIVTQRRPSVYEQLIPTLLNFAAQTGLMKMSQNWRGGQAEVAADRALAAEQRGLETDLFKKGWEKAPDYLSEGPTSGLAKDMGFNRTTPYGGSWKRPDPKVSPLMGKDGKHVGGQYMVEYDGKTTLINIPKGMVGPITAGEDDKYGYPVGTTYAVDLETDKTVVYNKPKEYKPLSQIKEETQAKSDISLKRQKDLAAHKATLPPSAPRPITEDDMNKRLLTLEQAKVKLQTTKGLDPLTLFLMQDNPEAQKAYQAGDISAAVAEIDRQIEYYTGLLPASRGLPLPKGLTEETVQFNMGKYGKTRREVILQHKKMQK